MNKSMINASLRKVMVRSMQKLIDLATLAHGVAGMY
jgi:hypothetical protein